MLSGSYKHTIDTKNRMFLPAKIRDNLGAKAVLTKGVDTCIALYPAEEWKKYEERLNTLPSTEVRHYKRALYANVVEVKSDTQGRIVIPPSLRELAKLQKEVVIVGLGDYAEIWSAEEWQRECDAQNSAETVETLIKLGF